MSSVPEKGYWQTKQWRPKSDASFRVDTVSINTGISIKHRNRNKLTRHPCFDNRAVQNLREKSPLNVNRLIVLDTILPRWSGPELFRSVSSPTGDQLVCFSPVFHSCCLTPQRSPSVSTRCFCLDLIFASLYSSVVYLLPIMIHGWDLHADRRSTGVF